MFKAIYVLPTLLAASALLAGCSSAPPPPDPQAIEPTYFELWHQYGGALEETSETRGIAQDLADSICTLAEVGTSAVEGIALLTSNMEAAGDPVTDSQSAAIWASAILYNCPESAE
jgi:hypothetical protein